MSRPVIELSSVSRSWAGGGTALREVSLTVQAGESVAILGPSGSGKSTLLNVLAGLDRPSFGSVTVDGVRVDQLREADSARYRRAKVGMVFQFFNLLDDLSVADNVVLAAELAGTARGEARRRATELLSVLGLAAKAQAHPGELSGGQRQRVAVARALMNRPALLLADEPTGALDSASGEDVKALLRELHADGQTLVTVTHDPALARDCATRVITLRDGLIESDTHLDAAANAGAGAEVRSEAAR